MDPIRRVSVAGQVAERLREELRLGRWRERMPGVIRLALELDVSRTTVESALRQLEREGVLVGTGRGRCRGIATGAMATPVEDPAALRPLRIGILLHGAPDRKLEFVMELQHDLEAAGRAVLFPRKSQTECKWEVGRVGSQVGAVEADAWVVLGGSRPVLEWFAEQPIPSLAWFGRPGGLSMAATKPDKAPAYAAATRELTGLGHRRIVLLCRKMRRLPEPGRPEQAFLDELELAGIPVGEYNLPDWEETIDGFHARLDSLFQSSPPTALIVDEPPLFAAVQQFLAERGIRVPGDVSLVSTDASATFDWCRTSIAHIRWDFRPEIRRIVRWAEAVSHHRADMKQILYPVEFVRGGTIGPVREG